MIKYIKTSILILLISVIAGCSCNHSVMVNAQQKSPIIVAHRGGAALGMENSISCIEKGIAAGADMVEVDIHLTSDNQIVVCHDRTVNRTTDGKGAIKDMTLAELRKLHLKDADGRPSNETLPTLDEVLECCKGRCSVLIEIKKKKRLYVGIEQKAYELVKAHGMLDQVVFQSFDDEVLFKLHGIDPALRLEKLSFFTFFSLEKYSFVESFNVYHWSVTKRFVRRMHEAGKEVKEWTVDKPSRVTEGVDGVITNNPAVFR